MERKTTVIAQADVERQLDYCEKIADITATWAEKPLAHIMTYGCQQNEADSERLRGYLEKMGYGFTDNAEDARIIVINTCAIREHAEQRVLGNVGALVHLKRKNPDLLICLCGCMMQEPTRVAEIKKSYLHVDLVFGTHVLWMFPEMLHQRMNQRKRVFHSPDEAGSIAEGIPMVRQDSIKGWVSIMYGCNNFCSYCIVPYVRGRERSRRPELILEEVRALVEAGYKDITLLGQNVNSYGKDLEEPMDFSDLLQAVNAIPGEFLIRFMTSHPKDATHKLFETMAKCEKVAPVIHLPFQAGNDRVLQVMNRRHTREEYLAKVADLKALIPDIVLTSDVIVGFPGETTEEFEDTLKVLEAVRYDSLFTFIYSPRVGTPAASMPDPMSREEKLANFNRLTALQDRISEEKHREYVGKTVRCLIDGLCDDGKFDLTARTPGNRLVRLTGDKTCVGQFRDVKITDANKWSLFGELA